MPVLEILDQEGNVVENAKIQDGAQVNVIEKITINGDTIQIGTDKDVDINLNGKVDKVNGYGLITESILEEGEDEFGLTPSGKTFQIKDKTEDSFYDTEYLTKLREILYNKVEKVEDYGLMRTEVYFTNNKDEFEVQKVLLEIHRALEGGGDVYTSVYSQSYIDGLRAAIAKKLTFAEETDIEGVFSNA